MLIGRPSTHYIDRNTRATLRTMAVTKKKLGRITLGVASFIVAAVVASKLVSYGIQYYQIATIDKEGMERALLASNMKLYEVLKKDFPSDYDGLLTSLMNILKSGEQGTKLQELAAAENAKIRKKYASLMVSAPDTNLRKLIASSGRFHAAILRRDGYQLCNRVVVSGAGALIGRAGDYIKEIDETAVLVIEALYQGKVNAVPVADPTDSDWEAVFQKLFEKHPQSYAEVIQNQEIDNPDLCPAFIALMDAVGSAEGEAGHRVRAALATEMAAS